VPKLRAAFKSGGKSNLWFCSICGSHGGVFFESSLPLDADRMRDLNLQFRKHCNEAHPRAQIERLEHNLTIVPHGD
jgi:hypothetical protein